MDILYVSAGIVACIFILAKFIEIRFISKPSEDNDGNIDLKIEEIPIIVDF